MSFACSHESYPHSIYLRLQNLDHPKILYYFKGRCDLLLGHVMGLCMVQAVIAM